MYEYVVGEFKFLIFVHHFNAPSTDFSWHVPKITQDARQMPQGPEKELALLYAEGANWDLTMFVFDLWRVRLYQRYLHNLIDFPPEAGATEWAQRELRNFPSDEEIFRPYGWIPNAKIEGTAK